LDFPGLIRYPDGIWHWAHKQPPSRGAWLPLARD
jgi:hypothetical protein